MDLTNSNWNVGTDFNFTPQVYAVTELPQGPAVDSIDVGILSGKSEEPSMAMPAVEKKESIPSIESPPNVEKEETMFSCRDDVQLDEFDPAFALFASAPTVAKATEPVYQIFGQVEFEKAVERFEIVVENEPESADGIVSASTMARFERLCASIDTVSERLDGLVALH